MPTHQGLEAWVQPQHLEERAIASYREAFGSHPARCLVSRDFLRPEVAASIHRFLSREAEFTTSYGLYSTGGYVSEEAWREAPDEDRFFRFGKLSGIRSGFQLSRNVVSFLKLRSALVDMGFKRLLEEMTGLALGDGSTPYGHRYGSEDYLRVHDDDCEDRCLTLVLYFSRSWRPEFGGALHMIDGRGNEEKLEAEYNSLVMFDVTVKAEHFIAPVRATAGEPRLSIGCWFLRPDRRP